MLIVNVSFSCDEINAPTLFIMLHIKTNIYNLLTFSNAITEPNNLMPIKIKIITNLGTCIVYSILLLSSLFAIQFAVQ